MKYVNFLQELKSLNPNMYVQVVSGFGNPELRSEKYAFSNTKVFIISDNYGHNRDDIDLEFGVIDSNYSAKILKVYELINSLDLEGKCNITRFTISPEPESDMPCAYYDIFLADNCELKVKIISDDLVEIYLDELS